MILSLQTDTFGSYGGIPTYNRLVCRALNDLNFAGRNCALIAMDDLKAVEPATASLKQLRISAFGGNRVAFAKAALSMALRERVELVLAGHVNYAPLSVLLKLFQPRMRFGVVIYGWEVWEQMPLLRRWSVRQADFLISISDYTKRQAVKINGLREDRISLLPNALEWSEVTTSPERQSSPRGITLLSVGRLDSSEQRKGFDTVIESLPVVIKRVPDLQYVVVGSGSDLERHKEVALNVGISDRVKFLGSVSEDVLHDCYESCDIFVMPSAQEGFGFVYLEAMKYGKAVVAANSGGAPEVVQDGVTGKLVEYGNKEELARTLIDLCLDQNDRQRLGQAGLQSLQERFTFAHFKETLTEILLKELPAKVVQDFRLRPSSATPDG